MFKSSRIIEIVKENVKGLDAFSIIPLVNLKDALQDTLSRLQKGLIPETYRWTTEKTRYAYQYKNYSKWAKSIFLAAKYYYTDKDEQIDKSSCYGKIAKYTRRNNYQYLIAKLKDTAHLLEKELDTDIKYKTISNYTSIPEKVLFNRAGLGKIGKNSLLINPKMGSYFVIGELITDLEVDFNKIGKIERPDFSICGNCNNCIDACPTNAIIENGVLNINRCLQYISENLILVDNKTREKLENKLYGCTICLDVCPYNHNLTPSAEKHDIGFVGSDFNLIHILEMNNQEWNETFSNNQIGIRDRLAIIKNALLAIGNLKCKEAKDILLKWLTNKNEIIRSYTVWALSKVENDRKYIKDILKNHLKTETSKIVKKEIDKLINPPG